MNLKDNLTIVIPCKNEGMGLVSTITQIIVHHGKLNIIVADSSTDDTLEYLGLIKFMSNKCITVVKGGLPSVARNNGFEEVKTPYVLFLDADMDISRVPLEKILADVQSQRIKLATCKITTSGNYSVFYKLFNFVQKIISVKTPFAVGGFMLFESQHFRELGKFNVEDKFAEDYHLSMKVDPKQFKIFNFTAHTSSRRFENKGVWYMCKMMIRCWLNKHDENFYKKDYSYWK
jgi:glycosyltransferase involved in cell wall biosynthesis